jgi:uncharacterized membrane protein
MKKFTGMVWLHLILFAIVIGAWSGLMYEHEFLARQYHEDQFGLIVATIGWWFLATWMGIVSVWFVGYTIWNIVHYDRWKE